MPKKENNELRYFEALKFIAGFDSLAKLRKRSDGDHEGYDQELEAAYETIRQHAAAAIHGQRKPTIGARVRESGTHDDWEAPGINTPNGS